MFVWCLYSAFVIDDIHIPDRVLKVNSRQSQSFNLSVRSVAHSFSIQCCWCHCCMHSSSAKRFCRAHLCVQQTDTQTTLHATFVAIGYIYAMHAMQPKNNSSNSRMQSETADFAPVPLSWQTRADNIDWHLTDAATWQTQRNICIVSDCRP